ncbi:fumarylacetoacetate hydrolase family protein [Eubacteriaceae bacterium ES3]|nr:fumarylacetoacetate hydrolase family protein [Eubacteriaceae bacterium ES3]
MKFITYQFKQFNEGGILNSDDSKVIPFKTIGKYLNINMPEKMSDFISIASDELITRLKSIKDDPSVPGISISQIRLLAPIPRPSRNIFCLGKNYAEHAREIKNIPTLVDLPENPIYFSKLPTTVTGPDTVVLSHPNVTKQIDYEVELAVIIGKEGSNIPISLAEEYIFGYTIANDITARDLQKKHSQWYKGKSLDTFCPLGPAIIHKSALPFPIKLDITSRVNGECRQFSNTSQMIFDIPTIINNLSQGVTLLPGDIILTGTPAGVGFAMNPPQFLKRGDQIEAEIESIGILHNTIE